MKSSITSPMLVCMAVLLKLQRPPGLGTAAWCQQWHHPRWSFATASGLHWAEQIWMSASIWSGRGARQSSVPLQAHGSTASRVSANSPGHWARPLGEAQASGTAPGSHCLLFLASVQDSRCSVPFTPWRLGLSRENWSLTDLQFCTYNFILLWTQAKLWLCGLHSSSCVSAEY